MATFLPGSITDRVKKNKNWSKYYQFRIIILIIRDDNLKLNWKFLSNLYKRIFFFFGCLTCEMSFFFQSYISDNFKGSRNFSNFIEKNWNYYYFRFRKLISYEILLLFINFIYSLDFSKIKKRRKISSTLSF